MADLTNPHDKFFRVSMQNRVIAKAFFERYLPAPVQAAINLESLKLQSSSYLDDSLLETFSDLVFDCAYIDSEEVRDAKVVLLVEHQSTPQRLLPFRVYHYMFNLLYRELKERDSSKIDKKLPVVHTLVFYHGKQTPYPYSLRLADCFNDPHQLMGDWLTGIVPLVDLNQEEDEDLKQKQLFGIMALSLKHSRDKDIRRYFSQLAEILNRLDLSDYLALNFTKSVLNYLLGVGNAEDIEQFIDESWRLPEPVRGEFMTIAEQLKDIGREEGREEGRIETQEQVAIRLLKEGCETKFAAKIAGLELAVVLKLKAQLEQS